MNFGKEKHGMADPQTTSGWIAMTRRRALLRRFKKGAFKEGAFKKGAFKKSLLRRALLRRFERGHF